MPDIKGTILLVDDDPAILLSVGDQLQFEGYEVVKAGNGTFPKATDTVTVHYTGRLIDGTVFDSSVQRGQPAEFQLDQVIPGWTEGIQKVDKGGSIKLYIPPQLAYGDEGRPGIPPSSTLIFDVELLDIKPAAPKG